VAYRSSPRESSRFRAGNWYARLALGQAPV
jgi:hypothetical protein